MNQHFPNEQCIMLQICAWVKDPFKDIPIDCNEKSQYEKFIDKVLDSTLQLSFKKLPLA